MKKSFNEQINKQALVSMREADLVLYFIDSSRESGEEEVQIEKIFRICKFSNYKSLYKIRFTKKYKFH